MRIFQHSAAAFVLGVMIIFWGTASPAEQIRPEEVFFKATQAQKEGRYQEAVEGYRRLIDSGYAGGHVYYNLGNAFFRLKKLGWAILYYERAKQWIPRDPDLQFNLSYARDLTRDDIPEDMGFVGHALFWIDSFSLDELFWAFAMVNVLFWAILFVRLFYRSEGLFYLFMLVLSLWVLGGLSYGGKYYLVHSDDRVVILKEEISVLAGPHIKDTVLFKLHEGAVAQQERTEEGWRLIHLPDGKRGWIPSKDAARIRETGPPEGKAEMKTRRPETKEALSEAHRS